MCPLSSASGGTGYRGLAGRPRPGGERIGSVPLNETSADSQGDDPGAEPTPARLTRALAAGTLAEWSVAAGSGRWLVASGLEGVYGEGAPAGREAADGHPARSPFTEGALGECLHLEDIPAVATAYGRLREGGEPMDVEARITRTDGAPRWIRLSGEPSAFSDDVPTRLSGHVRDVTELTRLRRANSFLAGLAVPLARLDDYADTLQQVASEAVPFLADRCIIDFVLADGTLHRVADSFDPSFASALLPPDVSAERVPAAPLIDRIVHGHQNLVLSDIGEAEVRGLSATEEQRRELQGFKPCDYIGTPLEIEGRCFGVLGILTRRDGRRFATQELELVERVAERIASALENSRLYARLREADERKAYFLATLSHELRNPLSAIVAGLDAIRDGVVAPAERATLGMIDRQAAGLTRLMDDLLDVARVDAEKFALDLEWISVTRAIDDAVAGAAPGIRDKRQRLTANAPEPDLAVRADRVRLEQILVNLLANACRYTPEGGSIAIAARLETGSVVIDVTDTGIGLDDGELERIFERFEQMHDGTGSSAGGLGLGLSLVRSLVALHGGTISARSAGKGLGSRFRLTLPHTRARVPASELSAPHARTARDIAPISVLLIDDNRDAADALGRVFERLGHTVVRAFTGAEGLDAYRETPAALVLLDIGLPDTDGYAVAASVREHERDAAVPPCHLVALTGYGQARDRDRALEAGFDDHVVKPVRLDGLRALAHAAAERHRDA